jgi:hypothetical protein
MKRPLPALRGVGAAALISTWLAFGGGPCAATAAPAPAVAAVTRPAPAAAAADPSIAPTATPIATAAAPDISAINPPALAPIAPSAPDLSAVTPPAGAPTTSSATTPSASGAPPAATATAGGAAGEDIRDIRGPKFILSAWVVAAVIAAALLLALAVYGVWRWLRRRRRPRALLPSEAALKRLAEIRTLMQPETAGEFSVAVSDVVRGYVEAGFGIVATHRTTEEFLRDLLESSNTSLARHRALLAEFLQQCDLVKFAGMSLTVESMESLHHSARVFVLETAKPEEAATPREPPTRAPPPAAGIEEARDSLPST